MSLRHLCIIKSKIKVKKKLNVVTVDKKVILEGIAKMNLSALTACKQGTRMVVRYVQKVQKDFETKSLSQKDDEEEDTFVDAGNALLLLIIVMIMRRVMREMTMMRMKQRLERGKREKKMRRIISEIWLTAKMYNLLWQENWL